MRQLNRRHRFGRSAGRLGARTLFAPRILRPVRALGRTRDSRSAASTALASVVVVVVVLLLLTQQRGLDERASEHAQAGGRPAAGREAASTTIGRVQAKCKGRVRERRPRRADPRQKWARLSGPSFIVDLGLALEPRAWSTSSSVGLAQVSCAPRLITAATRSIVAAAAAALRFVAARREARTRRLSFSARRRKRSTRAAAGRNCARPASSPSLLLARSHAHAHGSVQEAIERSQVGAQSSAENNNNTTAKELAAR